MSESRIDFENRIDAPEKHLHYVTKRVNFGQIEQL